MQNKKIITSKVRKKVNDLFFLITGYPNNYKYLYNGEKDTRI